MAPGKINKSQIADKDVFNNIEEGAKSAESSVKALEITLKAVVETAKQVKSSASSADPTNNKSIRERNELLAKSDTLSKAKLKTDKQLQRARLAEIKLQKDREKAFDRFEKTKQREINASIKSRKETIKENDAYKKLSKQVSNARNRLKRLSVQHGVNSKQAQVAASRYARLNKRLLEVNRSAQKAGGGLSRFGSLLKGGLGFLGLASAGTVLISALKGAGETIAEFDEGVTDLAKVTGLAKDDTRDLAEELLKIDTRTSVNEILALATAGGRLGLSGRELIEFTESADKAFVALGDSLEGSSEEIAVNLGKIASVFGVEEEFGVAESIEKIGSSLNDLGAKSKANEGRIQDFTNRISGVAVQANLSIPEVQALGALFDETGQSIEVAGSTINKLLPAIGKNTTRFAKIAGKDIKEFEELVANKPLEALKAVAVGAKSSEEGLKGLSKTLENYGINSARSASIVGILSSKTERLTELQGIANEAFDKGTSLSDEFALKNETLTAKVERLGNQYDKFILSVENGEGVLSTVFGVFIDRVSLALTQLENIGKGFTALTNGAVSLEEKFKIVANGIADSLNFGILLPLRKVAEGIDAISGTNIAKAFSVPTFELISTRVDALTGEFKKLTQEQIRNKDVAKGIVTEYVKAGLTTLEAVKAYKNLRIETNESSEAIGGNTDIVKDNTGAKDDNIKKTKEATGLIELQVDAISKLNSQIQRSRDESEIFSLGIDLEMAKEELERLKRIYTSTIEEIIKIEIDLIDDATDKRIAKEEEKSKKIVESIITNSRITEEKRLELLEQEENRMVKFREDAETRRLKKAIDDAAELRIAEFDATRSGFENETQFQEERAKQLEAIERNRLQAKLDLLKFYNREEDKLEIAQLEAQLAKQHEFTKKRNIFTEEEAEANAKAIQFSEDLAVKAFDARQERLEEEEEASRSALDEYKDAARDGNITAKESLAEQEQLAAEAARKQQKLEQDKQNFLLVTAVLQAFNAELAKTDDVGKALTTAITSTTVLSQFATALPAFLDGTENTGEHGRGVDGKGGFHAILHPNEKVFKSEHTDMIGNFTNEEVAQTMEKKRLGTLVGDTQLIAMANGVDMSGMEAELKDIKKAIIDKPETNIELGAVTQSAMEIVETRKAGNRTTFNRFKVK